ncbi:hypothetical protein ACRALDRAFT_213172 [Sodiomyces alcalophilus JCM 7366]|uniref:uncharacterized protein n=1 Tax=Sodiomyces alcalophilus JCM 7366 TaxID=591952 RepID=UPI0039B5609B
MMLPAHFEMVQSHMPNNRTGMVQVSVSRLKTLLLLCPEAFGYDMPGTALEWNFPFRCRPTPVTHDPLYKPKKKKKKRKKNKKFTNSQLGR